MRKTIGQQWDKLMDDHFVGRTFETGYFRRFLEKLEDRPERIMNVFGTAGMGKSYLLNRFAAIARELGAIPVRIDVREAMNDPSTVCRMMLQELGTNAAETHEIDWLQRTLQKVHERAHEQKIAFLIDGYEEAGGLDHWLRTVLLPELPPNLLAVIAGRYALEGPWRHAPAWRKLIVRLPLGNLNYEDIRNYMRQWGTTDEEAIDAVWLRTLGHPLAMSLLIPGSGEASSAVAVFRDGVEEPFRHLLDEWLREAPGDELMELLFAASVVRTFQQELLAEISGAPVSPTLFERLISLSFVTRTNGGWQLHELIWETLRKTFRERMPNTFEEYGRLAVAYAMRKIEERRRRGESLTKELAGTLHFAGNPIMRAHYRHAQTSPHYREPLHEGNSRELVEYADSRRRNAKAWNVLCSDPETGALYRFSFTKEETLLRLSLLEPGRLCSLPGQDVQLLRDGEGRVIGVFAAIPIHSETRPFLAEAPVSRALFRSLTPDRGRQLEAASAQGRAWYLYAVDVDNLELDQLRSDIVRHLFDYVLAGNLVVTSPPPLAYYEQAQSSLGFETVPGAEHDDYGTGRSAPTYWLDTRDGRLTDFLRRMIGNAGASATQASRAAEPLADFGDLTDREREVALLLATGNTNAEIAARLFVSEAAVKKHVNAMLSKFGLKNRTQLARRFLEKN